MPTLANRQGLPKAPSEKGSETKSGASGNEGFALGEVVVKCRPGIKCYYCRVRWDVSDIIQCSVSQTVFHRTLVLQHDSQNICSLSSKIENDVCHCSLLEIQYKVLKSSMVKTDV